MVIDDIVKCGYCGGSFKDGDIVEVDKVNSVAFHAYWDEINDGQFLPSDTSCRDSYAAKNPAALDTKLGMYWLCRIIGMPQKVDIADGKKAEHEIVNGRCGSRLSFNKGVADYISTIVIQKLTWWWPIIHDFRDSSSQHP